MRHVPWQHLSDSHPACPNQSGFYGQFISPMFLRISKVLRWESYCPLKRDKKIKVCSLFVLQINRRLFHDLFNSSHKAGLLAWGHDLIRPSQNISSGISVNRSPYSGGSAEDFHFIPYSP